MSAPAWRDKRASQTTFGRRPLGTQSSGPVPNARLLSADGASVFAQRMGEPPSKTQPASNAQSLHQTLQAGGRPNAVHTPDAVSRQTSALEVSMALLRRARLASNAITATYELAHALGLGDAHHGRDRAEVLVDCAIFRPGRLVCGLSAGRSVGDGCHRRWRKSPCSAARGDLGVVGNA
jgi:hypothetical protein